MKKSDYLEKIEKIEINGKSLLDWAKTDPHRLEKMSEQEFNKELREAMVYIYRIHVMGQEEHV
jgi:hypothetical protein